MVSKAKSMRAGHTRWRLKNLTRFAHLDSQFRSFMEGWWLKSIYILPFSHPSWHTHRSKGNDLIIDLKSVRYDIIAQLYHARRLAERLYPAARMVELHGGHLVSHERPDEVSSHSHAARIEQHGLEFLFASTSLSHGEILSRCSMFDNL